MEIYYRWHPLDGCRVRLRNSEQRSTGQIVYVEASSGVVMIIAAWMLEPVTCMKMTLGEPKVPRRPCVIFTDFSSSTVCGENHRTVPISSGRSAMNTSPRRIRVRLQSMPQCQISIAFEAVELRGIGQAQCTKILAHLTNRLMLAATGATKESDDEH